jgi:hypothetical protein
MTRSIAVSALVLCTLLCLATQVQGRELAGVTLADQVTVDTKALKLNGLGLRTRIGFKVYVAGLYVASPSGDAGALLKDDSPRRIELVFLRSVDKKKVVDAVRAGFEKNSKDDLPKLEERLTRFAEAIGDLKSGDHLVFTYVPGKGTTLSGVAKDTLLPGRDFADALLKVWIGASPVDSDCKKGMLGG